MLSYYRQQKKLEIATIHSLLDLLFGGGDRTRTDDPLLAKQVLSQLSYTPIYGYFRITSA